MNSSILTSAARELADDNIFADGLKKAHATLGKDASEELTRSFALGFRSGNLGGMHQHSEALSTSRAEAYREGYTAAQSLDPAAIGTEAAAAERDRIKAILALDEAKGRETSALHLALVSSISANDASALLAGLPLEVKDEPVQYGGLVLFNPAEPAPGRQSAASSRELWAKELSRRGP